MDKHTCSCGKSISSKNRTKHLSSIFHKKHSNYANFKSKSNKQNSELQSLKNKLSKLKTEQVMIV
jgi:hypothetical protein